MQVHKSDIRIARVLHEDDAFMTLEVIKDEHRQIKLEEGDKFLSLMFIKHDPTDNTMMIWTPWEDGDNAS